MRVTEGIEPAKVFKYFEEISAIPHGSEDTKRLSDHIAAFAGERSLECIQDEYNNLVIRKGGTAGYENSPSVMIQGHLDMVCEREAGSEHDFKTDGLKLKLENGMLSAEGTTLGGDDGIAVACCMALLDSEDIPHPPLEVVLTVDEEIGMLGAAQMDMSVLKSGIMINIDSEEEGILIAGCAGGVTTRLTLPVKRKYKAGVPVKIVVSGLTGGHSGQEIHKGRANASKLLGRALYKASGEIGFNLISVSGGTKDNAIPRSAEALLSLGRDTELKKLSEFIDSFSETVRREYSKTDPDICVKVEQMDAMGENPDPMDDESTAKVTAALVNLPNGVDRMSHDVDGLVETSLNLGILGTNDRTVTFSFCVRSSVDSEKEELVERIECLAELLGGEVENRGAYSAWEYRKDSPLRDTFTRVFEKMYGRKPEIQVIHAGLECGLFAGALKGIDIISFGPDIKDIHTTEEAMDVESVKRSWEYLLKVLEELK